MDPVLLQAHQRQALFQCRIALLAADEIDAIIQGSPDDWQHPRFWGAVQNLLTASANIAKSFWGNSPDIERRRRPLRESIKLSELSPLRTVRLRNKYEHYDEKLDDWWRKTKARGSGRYFVDMYIGSKSMVPPPPFPEGWFRHFDPRTYELTFWSESFNVRLVVAEIRRIIPLLEVAEERPKIASNPQA